MLREYPIARQVAGEPRRRWFASERCDLIVWLGEDDRAEGFQLCYDKDLAEHALTWRAQGGFSHMAVDSGEGEGAANHKGTPILVPDGRYDAEHILRAFQAEAPSLPPAYSEFVAAKLLELTRESGTPG